jgi:hypothetical protein
MPWDGSARDAVCGCSRFAENNIDVGSRLTTLTRFFCSKFIKLSGQGQSGVPTLLHRAPALSWGLMHDHTDIDATSLDSDRGVSCKKEPYFYR